MALGRLARFCLAEGMPLGQEQLAAFEAFAARLYELNAVMNLTRVPPDECELRHFIDSLLPARLIPQGSSVLDLGTGPGFPAWPLACARPDLRVTALDGSNKGLGFLRSQPLTNLEVVQARAEEWDRRESFDFVTGRALAPVPLQVELSAAWVKVGGLLAPFRTPSEQEAVQALPAKKLGLELEGFESIPLPEGDAVRLFPLLRKVVKTPREFPRTWARMKAKPL